MAKEDLSEPHLAVIEHDDKRLDVSVRISFDGIEYIGRLWFVEQGWEDDGVPDRGALPGRTKQEVLELSRRLTRQDLTQRYRRATAERRKFLGLRRMTDEVLSKIRYLNQVAISMRAGLLDMEGAAQEIDVTEKHLHDLIDRLRQHAGVEE